MPATVGFTLGKFAPFHRGHQLVVETALAEMDHVIVVIYDAAEANGPLAVRASWIRRLYPRAEVIEAVGGPVEVGEAPELTRRHDEYLRCLLADRGITHFYSSEFYGDHVSRAFNAVDRRIDPGRVQFAVSGRQIRRDPYAHRHFIHPLVYRDLVAKVVFIGAPSTGKTTLAEAMARQLGTAWMPEYGREYWERHAVDRRLTPEQLVEIAVEHRRREEELLLEADRYLFIDTDATTTRIFSYAYHGRALPALEALAEEATARYELTFLCLDDIPYADTQDRSGAANRTEMQAAIVADLQARRRPHTPLRGTLEERIAAVRQQLALLRPDRLQSEAQPGTE
jgi:HTH-type transcriptional repressor of NAD biosynthesis genes